MASATYHHIATPITTQAGLAVLLCLHVEFSDVPNGLNGETVHDEGLTFEKYRAQPNEESGEYSFILPPSDGSTDVERAHKGATLAVQQIATGRGFSIPFENITYAPI